MAFHLLIMSLQCKTLGWAKGKKCYWQYFVKSHKVFIDLNILNYIESVGWLKSTVKFFPTGDVSYAHGPRVFHRGKTQTTYPKAFADCRSSLQNIYGEAGDEMSLMPVFSHP